MIIIGFLITLLNLQSRKPWGSRNFFCKCKSDYQGNDTLQVLVQQKKKTLSKAERSKDNITITLDLQNQNTVFIPKWRQITSKDFLLAAASLRCPKFPFG